MSPRRGRLRLPAAASLLANHPSRPTIEVRANLAESPNALVGRGRVGRNPHDQKLGGRRQTPSVRPAQSARLLPRTTTLARTSISKRHSAAPASRKPRLRPRNSTRNRNRQSGRPIVIGRSEIARVVPVKIAPVKSALAKCGAEKNRITTADPRRTSRPASRQGQVATSLGRTNRTATGIRSRTGSGARSTSHPSDGKDAREGADVAVADPGEEAVVEAAANGVLADANRADDVPSAAHVPAAESIARRGGPRGRPKNRAQRKVTAAKKGGRPKASPQRAGKQKDAVKSVVPVGRRVIVLRVAIDPRAGSVPRAAAAQKADIARSVASGPKVVPAIDRGLGDLRARAAHPSEVHSAPSDPNRAPPPRLPTRSMISALACWKRAPRPRFVKTVTNSSHTNRTAANMVGANRGANIGVHRAAMSRAVTNPASSVSMTAATGSTPKVAARMRNLAKRLTSSTIARKQPRLRPRNPPTMADVRPAGAADGDVRARGEKDRQDRWIGRRQ